VGKILINNVDIMTMSKDMDLIHDGVIEVSDNIISFVGTRLEWECKNTDKSLQSCYTIIDGTNMLAMPGLINAHCHAPMSLFRGYADDVQLMAWLQEKIWPLEDRLSGKDVYWGTLLSVVEMIKSGTTSFADMYFFVEDIARAVEKSGIRAVLSRGMVGIAPTGREALINSKNLVRSINNAADGRITVMLGPHAPYTCPPEYMRDVVQLAAELDVPLHIHLSETAVEVEESLKTYGVTPIRRVQEEGLFRHKVLAAHCVHVTREDIEILAQHDVAVAHNPCSNLKLASGIAPVTKMLEKGVTVALGTDGPASNNNLDMFDEMKFAALIHKVFNNDATALSAEETLIMGTRAGAQAVGLDDKVGTLETGKHADIILLDLDKPHLHPRHNLKSHIVYSANGSDVNTVIVNGEILMQNRVLLKLDQDEIYEKSTECAKRLTGA
jgi:5-methylthioadenosine/S-adenosylhomocysteine deaminase